MGRKPVATDDALRGALEKAGGDVRAAAAALGITPETVVRRIVANGLFGRLCAKLQLFRAELETVRRECPRCGGVIFQPVRCNFCGDVIFTGTGGRAKWLAENEAFLEHIHHCGKHPLAFWTQTARQIVTAWDAHSERAVREAVEEFRKRLITLAMMPEFTTDATGRRIPKRRRNRGHRWEWEKPKIRVGARRRKRSNAI